MSTLEGLELKSIWNDVRRAFFPRWDRQRRWKVRAIAGDPGCGECLTGERLIEITPPEDVLGLELLLIHEICHAQARARGHGREWQARMRRAAERAGELGRADLAAALRTEVRCYRTSPVIKASHIYDRIQALAFEPHCPTLDHAMKAVAREYGISPNKLFAKYPKCRTVFERSRHGMSLIGTD